MATCPTCDRPDVDDQYCWTCGTPAGGPVVYPGYPTYRLRGLGIAAVVGIGAVVLVDAATGLFPLLGRSMTWAEAGRYEAVLMGAYLAALAVSGVLLITWMLRARRNLEAFPGSTAGWSPGWAVAGWFVPLANGVIPFLVMAGIARSSLFRARTRPWIAVWWVGYVGAMLTWNFGGAHDDLRSSEDALWDYREYYASALTGNVVSTLLLAISGAALATVLVRVGRAQEERLERARRPAEEALAGTPVTAGRNATIGP